MAPWGLGLGRDLLGGQAAVISTLKRLGGWDPFLNTARFLGVSRWGPGIGAMVAASAARYPTRIAISDDDTTVDYCTLDRQATNLAAQLRRLAGSSSRPTSSGSVGILCRNHRFFVIAQVAAERAGIDVVLMSPALPAPKLYDVLEREQVAVLIADEEFAATIDESGADVINISADGEGPQSLSRLAAKPGFCPPPARRARLVLLTSGTTGPPKGARRANRAPSLSDLGLFTNIPYQIGETYLVCPPLFHAWGLSQATTALATGSSVILRRKFDAGEVLSLLETTQIDVLAVVPLMMRRILRELDPENSPHHPRIVASSGNVLPGHLALAWMDTFGDHLYNVYGSTEAALGTIADPAALREAPGTVGRPPPGVTLSILDDKSMPLPAGEAGRVFVSSSMQFSGYSDGSDADRSGTLVATGDLGCLDDVGRLHIDGRANDMIITGGENVFPSRVEEVLDQYPGVELSAVVGVPDDEYGQRIVALVVPRPGWDLDVGKLLEAAASEMQSFMVPREVHLVDALPMTTTGKVIRHRLAVLGQAKHT